MFVPTDAPSVSFHAGHHIVQTIAIHVIDAHIRAAGARRPHAASAPASADGRATVLPAFPSAAAPTIRKQQTMSVRPSPLMSPAPMPCCAAEP